MDVAKKFCGVDVDRNKQTIIDSTTFLKLNDDCIEAIFIYLKINDLSSLSQTCKRIYKLGNEYFRRAHTGYAINITNTISGPVIKTSNKHVQTFQSNIRHIQITSEYWNLKPMPLFTFIRNNCCKDLTELQIDNVNLKPKELYGDVIKNQLRNLTTISFINCFYDIHNSFLKYCENLKHLIIRHDFESLKHYQWMSKSYPNLETLVYDFKSRYNSQEAVSDPQLITYHPLKEFLANNPQIKNVTLNCRRFSCITSPELYINLDYLVLTIEHIQFLITYLDDLKSLCENGQVRHIKLDFDYSVTFYDVDLFPIMLESLKHENQPIIDSLQFCITEMTLNSYHPVTHELMSDIKSLRLEVAKPICSDVFPQLSANFPNLVEFHLHQWWLESTSNVDHCIAVLAANLKNLKIIVIHRIYSSTFSGNFIPHVNELRNSLTDACRLTIYIPYDVLCRARINNLKGSLVDVQSICELKRDTFTHEKGVLYI